MNYNNYSRYLQPIITISIQARLNDKVEQAYQVSPEVSGAKRKKIPPEASKKEEKRYKHRELNLSD